MKIQNKGLRSQQTPQKISMAIIKPMAESQGWIRFLAILGFIGSGLIFMNGLVMLVLGTITGTHVLVASTFVYAVIGIIYFYPSTKLNQYASSIGWLRQTQTLNNLVRALEAQRAFWAFAGIVTIIILSILLLLIDWSFLWRQPLFFG